jgi:sortase B
MTPPTAPPTTPPEPEATPTPEETPAQDSPIDFNALKAINRNAVAWLYSPDTVIDYPVMRTSDYSYYLDKLPDGSKNANGSLFIDYNNASDFSSALTVIYGHNMKSGRMFGSLPSYKSQSYYNKHPYMYLYTERRSYRLDLIYGCTIGAGQWRERAFMYAENVASLISYAAHNTTFNSGVSYQSGDRVVALSTCTFEFNDARYVVLGILRGI